MGLFDKFKNGDSATSGTPLTFRLEGDFEIASCAGSEAVAHLNELRTQGRRDGFTVILLGGEEDEASLSENREEHETQECLRAAAGVDVEKWLHEQVKGDPEAFLGEQGEWPDEKPEAGSISAHLEVLSRKPKHLVYLAKIPTPLNWQAPAYIGMGGWNSCPEPAVLTAFAKRWHEFYGAEVVSITRDVMEFAVANPPTSKEAALALAKEQYVFCTDIVDQGVGDIAALAATLLNSRYWYFWWD